VIHSCGKALALQPCSAQALMQRANAYLAMHEVEVSWTAEGVPLTNQTSSWLCSNWQQAGSMRGRQCSNTQLRSI
jgi:hypothetical protein